MASIDRSDIHKPKDLELDKLEKWFSNAFHGELEYLNTHRNFSQKKEYEITRNPTNEVIGYADMVIFQDGEIKVLVEFKINYQYGEFLFSVTELMRQFNRYKGGLSGRLAHGCQLLAVMDDIDPDDEKELERQGIQILTRKKGSLPDFSFNTFFSKLLNIPTRQQEIEINRQKEEEKRIKEKADLEAKIKEEREAQEKENKRISEEREQIRIEEIEKLEVEQEIERQEKTRKQKRLLTIAITIVMVLTLLKYLFG